MPNRDNRSLVFVLELERLEPDTQATRVRYVETVDPKLGLDNFLPDATGGSPFEVVLFSNQVYEDPFTVGVVMADPVFMTIPRVGSIARWNLAHTILAVDCG